MSFVQLSVGFSNPAENLVFKAEVKLLGEEAVTESMQMLCQPAVG